MPNCFLLIFALLPVGGGFRNLDFEEGKTDATPPGWTLATSPGFQAILSAEDPRQGNQCLVLEKNSSEKSRFSFGKFEQQVDASPYRGKRVLIRSFVRTEPRFPDNQAQVWVRVDREGGAMGFYDDMGDRPIRSSAWRECKLVADVDGDAQFLSLGLLLLGKGRVFWDAIQVKILDPSEDLGNEPPKRLEGRALENVEAFGRLFGYIRYFYPGDEAANADWELFAVEGIRFVESAKDAEELARSLEQWGRVVAPAIRVFPSSRAPEAKKAFVVAKEGARKLVFWHHHGLGIGKSPGSGFRSWRIRDAITPGVSIPSGVPDPEAPYEADLGGGVSCLVPLALYEDDNGTTPRAAKPNVELSLPRAEAFVPSANDRATRLANVVLAWNVFQHFYPYFDDVKVDWPSVLQESLKDASDDPDEKVFLLTLRRMVAQLHDGHGWVQFAREPAYFQPPIAWEWIENQLIITKVLNHEGDIHPGDAVTHIEGVPAIEALKNAESLISSATPQFARFWSPYRVLWGERGSVLTVRVKTQGGMSIIQELARELAVGSEGTKDLLSQRPEKIAEISPGVVYIDLERVSDGDFDEALPKLSEAKGIIFDLRGYPYLISHKFLGHLSGKPLESPRWLFPEVRFPDRKHWKFDESARWTISPRSPKLKGRVVFLTDGRAISYAETLLGIVEFYKLGNIVGGWTAGTNGNINPFSLPGGYTITWTGLKTLRHDGSTHHGLGIRPTTPFQKTIRGIIHNKNELLERAIEIASD